MNIEPICKFAMEFLRKSAGFPSPLLQGFDNIGEVAKINFADSLLQVKGFLIVSIVESRILGFKRTRRR